MSDASNGDRLTAYLLGRLSAEEEQRVEEEYVGDEAGYLELRAAEDDLVDDFAAGALSAEDRKRFEERLLAHPDIQARVVFAQALRRTAQSEPETARRPRLLPFLAAASLIAAVGAGFAAWRLRDTRAALAAAAAREESLRAEVARQGERIAELARGLAGASTGIATWTLRAGRTRDTTSEPPAFPAPAAGWVRLHLPLERDAYARYTAVLRTPGGDTLVTVPAERAGPGALEVMMPAASLRPSTYDVVLLGAADARRWEESDVYPLRIADGQTNPRRP